MNMMKSRTFYQAVTSTYRSCAAWVNEVYVYDYVWMKPLRVVVQCSLVFFIMMDKGT